MSFRLLLLLVLGIVAIRMVAARPTVLPSERQRTAVPLGDWRITVGEDAQPTPVTLPLRWDTAPLPPDTDVINLSATFTAPKKSENGLILRIESSVGTVAILLDGVTLTEYLGNGMPHALPLTVESGTTHTLSCTLSPVGLPAAWRPACGLGAINLELQPAAHLDALRPQFSTDGAALTVTYRMAATTATSGSLRLELRNAKGQLVAQGTIPVKLVDAPIEGQHTLRVKDIRRWSPETPHLYRLHATLTTPTQGEDRWELPCGPCAVSVERQGMTLNGAPILLRGLRLPGGVPPFADLPLIQTLERELTQAKRAGFNALMSAGPAFPAEILTLADRLGFMVLYDVPRNGAGPDVLAALERYGHHPCIIAWHWTADTLPPPEITTVRPLDPYRPLLVSDGASTHLYQTLTFGSPITALEADVTWPPSREWQAVLHQAEQTAAPFLLTGVGMADTQTTGVCDPAGSRCAEGRAAYCTEEEALSTLRGAVESVRRAATPLGYFVRPPHCGTLTGLGTHTGEPTRFFTGAQAFNQICLLALRATATNEPTFDAAVLNEARRTGELRLYQLLRHPDGHTTIANYSITLSGTRVQPFPAPLPKLAAHGEYRLQLVLMDDATVISSAQSAIVLP